MDISVENSSRVLFDHHTFSIHSICGRVKEEDTVISREFVPHPHANTLGSCGLVYYVTLLMITSMNYDVTALTSLTNDYWVPSFEAYTLYQTFKTNRFYH